MSGFNHKVSNNIEYYTIDKFEETMKVKTCFSTRIGGISTVPYDSLNFGYNTLDCKDNINENFRVLSIAAGFKIDDMVLSDQVHGNKVKVVDICDRGKGIIIEGDISATDALVTNDKNIALCIFTADCVPVFLFDIEKCVIALCHAGWRGIINEIVPKTVDMMKTSYGSKPQNIIAAIAPSIGPCCFNVNMDVARKFNDVFQDVNEIVIKEKENYKINLWSAVEKQLEMSGIFNKNISSSKLCTCCNKKNFYSYRRDGSDTGRMISIIQIK